MTRRSTRTMTVLSQASLTTTPWRIRFGMLCPLGGGAVPLAENGLNARNVAPHVAHPRGIFELPAGALETQVEDLSAERVDLLGQLVHRAGPQVGGLHSLHGCAPSPSRV